MSKPCRPAAGRGIWSLRRRGRRLAARRVGGVGGTRHRIYAAPVGATLAVARRLVSERGNGRPRGSPLQDAPFNRSFSKSAPYNPSVGSADSSPSSLKPPTGRE